MPKVSKIQASFKSGQVSNNLYGRVDAPTYDASMALLLNYMPIEQGPIIRRPGTQWVTYANSPFTQPPALVPFQFSLYENYMLELGGNYIRFYTNQGQVVTSSNLVNVTGFFGLQSASPFLSPFQAVRATSSPQLNETIQASQPILNNLPLQVATPYGPLDVPKIKWAQKYDTLYLFHPSYPPNKLVRTALNQWSMKQVLLQDGPYLPFNSYLSPGDSTKISFTATNVAYGSSNGQTTSSMIIQTGNGQAISGITSGTSNLITIASAGHGYSVGDQVCIIGVTGTVEANNVQTTLNQSTVTNSTVAQAYWVVTAPQTNTFQLANSVFVNNYASGGTIRPAIFQLFSGSSSLSIPGSPSQVSWADINVGSSNSLGTALRPIGLVTNGIRYWGYIAGVLNSAQAFLQMSPQSAATANTVIATCTVFNVWQLGSFNYLLGFPSAGCFHQDRLMMVGSNGNPQEVDGSMTSQYEIFSASGSNFQVANNNALQFNLASQDLNALKWVNSNSLGLLCGTQSAEFAVNSGPNSASINPTNINALQVSFYGSYDADALDVGNAVLYVQRAQGKVREMLYYWQIQSFRSSNLSELSETLMLPGVVKLVNQKQPHPQVWALRSDGQLLSMAYNRDEVTLEANAGWALHQLGGVGPDQTSPVQVNSIGCIPSQDGTFDQLWLVTSRFMGGITCCNIEYMAPHFQDNTPQENAIYLDAGVTFNNPISVQNISKGSSCVVTASAHGLSNSTVVRFYSVVGMNQSTTDVNGNTTTVNQFNENTFVVQNAAVNTFMLADFLGNYINTNSSTSFAFFSSSAVRALITNITGLSWLQGNQVALVGDGAIMTGTSVNNAGHITLPSPAAIVQIGFPYNSNGQMLRTKDGSAQGTSIGSTRRVNRVAFMLHNVGDLSFGPNFNRLIPAELSFGDSQNADTAIPLYSGIHRDGIESDYGFDDMTCFRQNSGLPGTIQAITRFLEEEDV